MKVKIMVAALLLQLVAVAIFGQDRILHSLKDESLADMESVRLDGFIKSKYYDEQVVDWTIGKKPIDGDDWHYENGKPIQPLSAAHHNGYVDYSHGVRLVCDEVLVNGKRHSIKNYYKTLFYTDCLATNLGQ